MPTETAFFALPIVALLYMAGGTFHKSFRRFGIPLFMAVFGIIFLGWHSGWITLSLGYVAVLSLPFTLIGDDVNGHFLNFLWIWVFGYLLGLPALVIGVYLHKIGLSLALSIIPCLLIGISATLSNLKVSRNFMPWKLVEFIAGFSMTLPVVFLIYSNK